MMKTKIISALAALSIATLSTQTFAGGPLAICESGTGYKWTNDGFNIPFNPDQGDLGPLTNADATALVGVAFQVWQDVPTSVASYINAGTLPVDIDQTNFNSVLNEPAPNGLSEIVFDDDGAIFSLLFGPGSGILGFAGPTWGTPANCEIIEGYAFLNGPAFTNATAALDVIVHEFGHYTNLAHTVVNGQQLIGAGDTSGPEPFNTFGDVNSAADTVETMYPFYFGAGIGTQTLHRDDIASISTLYPSPTFEAITGSISGIVFNSNGSTKLTGVNVIARNIADPFVDAVSAISSDFTNSTAQSDPVVGTYKIEGLTPGASYAVYVDEILAGGFSTPVLSPLPGPEEFYNGVDESNNITSPDDPSLYTPVPIIAGVDQSGVDFIFNAPRPGDPLAVGIDGNVSLNLPFDYEICGETYSSVFVNANGNLTFGSGDFDFTESASDMINDQRPRIAGLWDDFNPNASGSVFYTETSKSFTVTWDSVPEFFNTGSNTFSITIYKSSDHIDMEFGELTATDGISGVSCGGFVTGGAGSTIDLSNQGRRRINLKRDTALFEVFDINNPVDLSSSTVRFNGTFNFEDNWAEDNDTLGTARNIKLPFSSLPVQRYTEIEPAGADVDFYMFTAEADTTLFLEVVSGNLDSLIGIYDANGVLLDVDDDGGTGLLSRLTYNVSETGTYYLGVTTFPDFAFTGAGNSGGRYILDLQAIDGTILSLGDDSSQELALDFPFPYQGATYTSVWVNSNGNLTFGSGDTDFSESVSELLNDQPRIAALWDDLAPNNGGLVIVESDASSFSVRFEDVPEFFSTGSNTFTISLFDSGRVEIAYGDVTASDGIVGLSAGGGALDPGATDLSGAGLLNATGTTYEQFTFGSPFDLDNTTLVFEP